MADFSCYVTFQNNSSYTMTRTGFTADTGHFTQLPPASIAPGTPGDCVIQDSAGAAEGSAGSATYQITDGNSTTGSVKFSFADPYDGDNAVSAQWVTNEHPQVEWNYKAETDGGDWQNNSIDRDGHPVYVEFTIKND